MDGCHAGRARLCGAAMQSNAFELISIPYYMLKCFQVACVLIRCAASVLRRVLTARDAPKEIRHMLNQTNTDADEVVLDASPEKPVTPAARREPAPPPVAAATTAVPPPAGAPARKRRGGLRRLLMLGGIAVVIVGAGWFWVNGGRYVSVDDAYVHADKLLVATDVSGIVQAINVKEGQHVEAGDVLFSLDPKPFQYALAGAEADRDSAALDVMSMEADYQRMLSDVAAQEATVDLDQAQFERLQALVKTDSVSKSAYDQARYSLETDKKKLESLRRVAQVMLARLKGDPSLPPEKAPAYLKAQAQVDEFQRQLDHTVVRAPFTGTVTEVDSLQPGQYLAADSPAFALVSSDNVWIEANAKETDLTDVKEGDPAEVSVDTYPGLVWQGRVSSISPASGAEFSVLPAQNASGNWVKVVQRIPVRIAVRQPADAPPLRAGMSVVAEIDTGHTRHLSDLWSGFLPSAAARPSAAATPEAAKTTAR